MADDLKQILVLYIFKQRKLNQITDDQVVEQLNELQDKGTITQADREILGWKLIFGEYC